MKEMNNIFFSKEEVLRKFTTGELIAEVVSRKDENLDRIIENYLIAGVILKGKVKISEEFKQELKQKLIDIQ